MSDPIWRIKSLRYWNLVTSRHVRNNSSERAIEERSERKKKKERQSLVDIYPLEIVTDLACIN